jgi:glutaredoxin-related protein
MIKIYGSMLCKDCVQCREELDNAGVAYEYLDFSENLLALKEFLSIRDSDPQFDEVRQNGGIGIPCIVREDGTVSLDWAEFM